jgi:hypothetical protein
LTRALTGVDYTKPDESDPEIYRNTVLSTAKGSGAKPHNREIKGRFSNDGLRIDHWKQANECIRSCICSIMAGLNQNLESIKSDINKACEQLPTSKLDDETVRIGLTLQKILETVTVYEVDDRSLPPIDDVDQKVKEEVQRRGKE